MDTSECRMRSRGQTDDTMAVSFADVLHDAVAGQTITTTIITGIESNTSMTTTTYRNQ